EKVAGCGVESSSSGHDLAFSPGLLQASCRSLYRKAQPLSSEASPVRQFLDTDATSYSPAARCRDLISATHLSRSFSPAPLMDVLDSLPATGRTVDVLFLLIPAAQRH